MREYIEIGPCPAMEDCAQVGDDNYRTNARRQCLSFMQGIRNYLGMEPDGAALKIKTSQHDFGSYLEVACFYDPENEKAAEYAFKCEAKAPQTWEECGVKEPDLMPVSKRGRA
jgi:hypothetical protein